MATATATRTATEGRRERILAAALDAFTDGGYAESTIADVRRGSGASVGSIYHHFGDKQGLASALYVECLGDYQRGVAVALAASRGPEAGIRAVVTHHLDWVQANPRRALFLFARREPELAEASAPAVRELNLKLFATVREWLRTPVEAGAIRRMPLELFYVIVLGPSQEYARHWLRDPDPDRIAAARRVLARAAWDAVRANRKERR